MKLRPLAAVISAVLLVAAAAFAQDSQGATGAESTVITGTVITYTPNQSITVREANGQTRQINLGADSSVAPDVKVGSCVMISQSEREGRCLIRVEPVPSEPSAQMPSEPSAQAPSEPSAQMPSEPSAQAPSQPAAPMQRLPRTASGYPLMGLFGLLSLGAAAGIRVIGKRLA